MSYVPASNQGIFAGTDDDSVFISGLGSVLNSSSAVRATQTILRSLGYKGADGKLVAVDGVFGGNTLRAQCVFALDAVNESMAKNPTFASGLNALVTGTISTPEQVESIQKALRSMSPNKGPKTTAFLSMQVVGGGGGGGGGGASPPSTLPDVFSPPSSSNTLLYAGGALVLAAGLGFIMLRKKKGKA